MRKAPIPPQKVTYTIKDGVRVPDSELGGREAKVVSALRLLDDRGSSQVILEVSTPSASAVSTGEIVVAFLLSKRAAVADTSLTSYRGTLRPFAKQYPVLPTTPQEIEAYLARFNEKRSASGAWVVLKMLYKFASSRYGVPNAIESVQRPRFREKEPYSLTQDEARAVLASCNDERELGLVHLYLGHGFRLDEAVRGYVGDIGDGLIQVHGKTRTEHMPLLPETRGILLVLAGSRGAEAPLFLSQHGKRLSHKQTYNVVKAILNRAGVVEGKAERVATHTLRKTFATMALAAGCDGRIVARLLRHRRRDTTDLYLAIHMGMLRQYLERFSPIRLLNGQPPLAIPEQLPKTEYFRQLESNDYLVDDPARLIPELLDRLAALGDLAKRTSRALGNNGHRADQVRDLTKQLQRQD
ncbi:Tyrosine recombinase XerC [subsurface metagenome]